MQKFCEQFVGKFNTPKIEVGQKFYFEIQVHTALSLSIFDGFQQMRDQNSSKMV